MVAYLRTSHPWTDSGPRLPLLVKISAKDGGGTSRDLYFSDGPVFDSSIIIGASVGMGTTVLCGRIDVDGDAGGELGISLRNVAYSWNDAAYGFSSLGAMLSTWTFHGAPVRICEYAVGVAGTPNYHILYDGWIENVNEVTHDYVNFTATMDAHARQGLAPLHTVGGAEWPWDDSIIPDMSKALAVPFRLGPPSYIPRDMRAIITEDDMRSFLKMGVPSPALVPARWGADYRRNGTTGLLLLASQEQLSTLAGYKGHWNGMNDAQPALFEYVPQADAFAFISGLGYDGYPDTRAQTDDMYSVYVHPLRTQELILLPTEYEGTPPAGLKWGKMADRKIGDYVKLSGGVGAKWQLKIPCLPCPGTINAASGSIQVVVYTLGTKPAGETQDPYGSFDVGIMDPVAGTYQFGSSDLLYPTTQGWQSGGDHPTWTSWRGTKWQQWDFSGSASTATGDPDAGLRINNDTQYAGRPFDVCIRMRSASSVAYVAAIGLLIQYTKDSAQLWAETKKKRKKPWWKRISISQIDHYIKAYQAAGPWGLFARHKYDEWATARKRGQPSHETWEERDEEHDPENLYLWFPGLYDELNTYGGGVGWLKTPGAIMQYLATHYSTPTKTFTVGDTTTFGSIVAFDTAMNRWAMLGLGQSTPWRSFFWVHEQTPLNELYERMLEELPGMPMFGKRPDGSMALIAHIEDPAYESYNDSAFDASFPISVHRDIRSEKGSPRIQLTYSPISSVYNDIEVHYQYDPIRRTYGAIARAWPDGATDGAGCDYFPDCPGSGNTITQLLTTSANIYNFDCAHPRKLIIKTRYMWDPEQAVALVTWLAWRHWRPIANVQWEGGLSCNDLLPGQLVEFSDDLRTIGKLACTIPQRRGVNTWTGVKWIVTKVARVNMGKNGGIVYQCEATEHLNNYVGVSGNLFGGPVLAPASEGFDQ